MEGLVFALAELSDATSIERLRNSSDSDLATKLGLPYAGDRTRLHSIKERIRLADTEFLRKTTLFVARCDGEVLGSVAVSTWPPGFWKKSYWEEPGSGALGVFGLMVLPERQRQGVGSFLMAEVEQLAQEHGLPFVRLDAYERNPISNGFYQAIGYSKRAVINLRGTGLVLYEKKVWPPS